MWVNPESGQTWEQIAETVWRTLRPTLRAKCEAYLAATGKTREQFCQDMHREFQADLAEAERNPDSEFAQQLDRMAFPYGHDPLLSRSEP